MESILVIVSNVKGYIDDVVIHSETEETPVKHLVDVFAYYPCLLWRTKRIIGKLTKKLLVCMMKSIIEWLFGCYKALERRYIFSSLFWEKCCCSVFSLQPSRLMLELKYCTSTGYGCKFIFTERPVLNSERASSTLQILDELAQHKFLTMAERINTWLSEHFFWRYEVYSSN